MMHEEEIDPIEQLFRQESADLEEIPSAETWQKLQKKLSATPRKARRPVPLFQTAIAAVLALLLLAGAAAWYVAREHNIALKHQKAFQDLSFWAGNWHNNSAKTEHTLELVAVSNFEMRGMEKIGFNQTPIVAKEWSIYFNQKQLSIRIDGDIYVFDAHINSDTFIFKTTTGSRLKLRRQNANRFTLSFDTGIIFTFDK